MRRRSLVAIALVAASSAVAIGATAQSPRASATTTAAASASVPTNLRAHIGGDVATRLLRSHDPDERIRGIRRAGAIGSTEAIALLAASMEGGSTVRSDPRALLELARALAPFVDQERARAALLLIVNAAPQAGRVAPTARVAVQDDGDDLARVELARQTAAIALAHSHVDRALEQLYGVARTVGVGQGAAVLAIRLEPPREPGFFGTTAAGMSVPAIRMLGQLGDLRALEVLHASTRSTDVNVRAAAILSIAELGDLRVVGIARAAITEADARLRAAAGNAFVLVNAPERFKATSALIEDDATTALGIALAERVHHPDITKLLAARSISHPSLDVRLAAIIALGRSPDPGAATALASPKLSDDDRTAYPAALALARSPAPNAVDAIVSLARGKSRTLAIRAYVMRALVRAERRDDADALAFGLTQSSNVRERALGVFSRVALGDASLAAFIDDREPRVRRAAAIGALARSSEDDLHLLLSRVAKEPDAATRQVFAVGLRSGDPDGLLTTTFLIDRAEGGEADAALAAYALARRANEPLARKVEKLLASKDPVVRAHTARGLAFAPLPDASGRLAEAYAYETEPSVRRAIAQALAARTTEASAPARKNTLTVMAGLDPDGPTRLIARRALEGVKTPFGAASSDVAWVQAVEASGLSGRAYVASIVDADGTAVPFAFDDEGFALVPGIASGQARLVLAPRLPSYEPAKP